MTNAHAADLTAYIGASGSGKSLLLKAELRPLPRLRRRLIWSPKETLDRYAPEFGEPVAGDSVELVRRTRAGDSVVYVPDRSADDRLARQFALFCALALEVGDRHVIVEEMSIVATSRNAPARWTLLVTEGRGRGLSLRATTQRPQLCDASLLDAATEIYCGRLQRGSSHKIMADVMGGLPVERVRGLRPLEFLHWRVGADAVELVNVKPPRRKK